MLSPGQRQTGIFIGLNDNRYEVASGALWLDPTEGQVKAEIPFLAGDSVEAFQAVAKWFKGGEPPRNLLFRGESLRLSLFGCTLARLAEPAHLSIGSLRVRDVVESERTGSINDPLTVSVLISEIDGLQEWTGLRSINRDFDQVRTIRGGLTNKLKFELERRDGITWLQGAAQMYLYSSWLPRSQSGIDIHERVVLKSRFPEPRSLRDHLMEHEKFRDLLVLSFGTGLYFRRHEIRDERFPTTTLDGTIHGADPREVISGATALDSQRPIPTSDQLFWSILDGRTIAPRLLTRWATSHRAWRRSILPARGVLLRSGLFSEDILVNASMSVEAIGPMIGRCAGEQGTYSRSPKRRTTATNFYRLLAYSGLDLSKVSDGLVDTAQALADTYNIVKHADRGDFPDGAFTYFAGRLALVLARVAMLKLLAPNEAQISNYVHSWAVGELISHMQQNGIAIRAKRFVRPDTLQ